MLLTKGAHQSDQIPYVIFQTTDQFFFKIASTFSVMTHESSVIFSSRLYTLNKKVSQSANFKIFEWSG